MSDIIVADVRVRERHGRRTTTITVIEGRGGDVWSSRATSLPPVVREKLAAWLADVPPACGHDDSGGVHVEARADTSLSADAPGFDVRVSGFRPGETQPRGDQ